MNSKSLILISFIVLLYAVTFGQSMPEVSMLSGWVFQKGDNMDWKHPEFDDSKWLDINPNQYWDYMEGFGGYDGYAWYRIRVYIPSALKADAVEGDSLHVCIGRVDDNDQTFLNGVLIGENGRNASGEGHPEFAGEKGAYARQREYTLPLDHPLIKWDAVNVIAVRAYDFYLTGGLTNTNHRLYVRNNWTEFVSLNREDTYLSRLAIGDPFHAEFSAENTSDKLAFDANFFAEITMKETGKSVATFLKTIHLDPKETVHIPIEFIPYTKTRYEIEYRLIDNKSGQTYVQTSMLGIFMPKIQLLSTPIQPVVEDKIKIKYHPVDFSDIEIKGMLAEKMDVNLENGLLHIPYQLMEPYIEDFEPPWPIGEFVGKLLHGNTKMLQYQPDQRLLETTAGVIQIWLDAQQKDGYLGTNSPETRWKGWDVWDHKYLILAFVHYYVITGYEPALEAAIKIGDLVSDSFGYQEGQLDLVDGYHKGMAPGSILEPMVYLYKYTGDQKYLDFCQYILKAYEQENGPRIVSVLTEGSKSVVDVGNAKGYEMTSCIIGLVQLYKVTGEEKLIQAALNAWNDIQQNRLYVTGTSTSYEHFQKKGYLPAGPNDNMGETCVTAHWMYLSKELFKLYGEQKYIDEIEKSLYNHLLAAQHPISGDIVYYSALQARKWYMELDMYLGPPLCCHMSAKRCITEIPEFSYYLSDKEIGVLLYNSSIEESKVVTKKGKEVTVRLTVDSKFPYENTAVVTVDPNKKSEFTVTLRVPVWCKNYTASVRSEQYNGRPGEFLKINRPWKKGDKIKITMDFPLIVLDGGESYPEHATLKYGPQVLAVDSDVNQLTDWEEVYFDDQVDPDIKVYKGKLPKKWMGKQAFVSNAIKKKDGGQVILVPYADASQTGGDIRVWIKK